MDAGVVTLPPLGQMVVLTLTALGGTGLVIGSAAATYIIRMLRRYRTAHARRDPVRNTETLDINVDATVEDLDATLSDQERGVSVPPGVDNALPSGIKPNLGTIAVRATVSPSPCTDLVLWSPQPITTMEAVEGKLPADRTGRKLARVCGETVRMQLGFPTRSRANIVLCSQRCEAWLRENAPNLRNSMFSAVHKRALLHALVPSASEVSMFKQLNSAAAAEAEHQVNSIHWIKTRNVPDWIANVFQFWAPSQRNF